MHSATERILEIRNFDGSWLGTTREQSGIHWYSYLWEGIINFYSESLSILKALGTQMVQKDQNTAWSLFDDFGLIKIVPILKQCPLKRPAILDLIYKFCANDPNVRKSAIQSLQEKMLDDSQIFVHCLAILIKFEKELPESLLDLYSYYCIIGMSNPSSSLRAASIGMLSVLCKHKSQSVMPLLGTK